MQGTKLGPFSYKLRDGGARVRRRFIVRARKQTRTATYYGRGSLTIYLPSHNIHMATMVPVHIQQQFLSIIQVLNENVGQEAIKEVSLR